MNTPYVTPEGRAGVLGSDVRTPVTQLDRISVPPGLHMVRFQSDELVCKCPVTGQTDIYQIQITMVPNEYSIETKSLKLYLAGYKELEEGVFAEVLVDKICQDLFDQIEPLTVEVSLVQNIRGGIQLSVMSRRDTSVEHAVDGLLGDFLSRVETQPVH